MFKDRYLINKEKLLNNEEFNSNNRETIKKFLEFEEYKLKRKEGLVEVDERSYKTLTHYITRIKKINEWFKNKDWSKLTEKDIKKLIDDLEDGIIKNKYGKRYEDRSVYYQMLQGKFFSLVKKSHIAKQIIEDFSIRGRDFSKQVRFIEEESFRKIVDCALTQEHRCLLWLAFDIGENIGTLLELTKDDVKRQVDSNTNEPEYLIILSKDKLKRSRTPRSELTNYKETVQYLDIVLKNLKPSTKRTSNKFVRGRRLSDIHSDDKLFKFGMKAADTFLKRAVEQAGVRVLPGGEQVTWKDLRSSMCCSLLKRGWSLEECNARLGHRPSSRVIDRYVNFLSLDRRKPKTKVYQSNLKKMEIELEKQKDLNKLQQIRFENLKNEQDKMKIEFKQLMSSSKVELLKMLKDVKMMEEVKTINN